jgi:hypothetical protein
MTDVSTSTGSLTYRIQLDTSQLPDGNNTVALRIKNGASFQNIGTIKFYKIDAQYSIQIDQPNTTQSISKTISATLQ